MSILWPRRAIPRLSAPTEVATPPTLGSSVWTNCKIFKGLDNETFRPLKIFAVARERFCRARRNAGVKLIGIGKRFVEKRFCTKNTVVRERAAAEQDTTRSDEAVVTHAHRL